MAHRSQLTPQMSFVERDGVRLAYCEAGSGPETVLLIHGMACDHTHLEPQFRHLSRRFRVVSIDMRGHGASDKPDGSYASEVFGADLLHVVETLGLGRPIFIGHSLGGSIALDLAVHHPEVFRALVMLDSGIRAPGPKSAELGPFYASLGGPDHAERVEEFVRRRLVEAIDGETLIAQIAATMAATPAKVFLAMGEGVLNFNSAAAAAANTGLETLLVLGARPFADPACVAALTPNWQVGQVVGSGHFVQLVVPAQVNIMIDRFIELLPPV